jgi:hypothetical protein
MLLARQGSPLVWLFFGSVQHTGRSQGGLVFAIVDSLNANVPVSTKPGQLQWRKSLSAFSAGSSCRLTQGTASKRNRELVFVGQGGPHLLK